MVANVDGTGLFQADSSFQYVSNTTIYYSDLDPSWSYDGRWIAFNRSGKDLRDSTVPSTVELFDSRSRTVRELVSDARLPAFAPDGRVAFVKTTGNADLMIVNVDGTGVQNRTQGRLSVQSAARWSFDGKLIALAAVPPGGSDSHIFLMRSDGSGLTDVTPSLQGLRPKGMDLR
jgi:TolB protein